MLIVPEFCMDFERRRRVCKCFRYGNASSAAKNTIPGDMPSLDREEIENIIHDHETVGYHSEMNR